MKVYFIPFFIKILKKCLKLHGKSITLSVYMMIVRLLSGIWVTYRLKALRVFFIAALLSCVVTGTRAGEISVTAVTRDKDGSITLVFNTILSVGGITAKEAGDTRLNFPSYVSRRGVSFPQVKLLTRQAKEAAEKAAANGVSQGKEKTSLTFAVSDIRPYRGRSSSLKGFAVVTFNNAVAVDCKIMMSGGRRWVAWPSVKDGETWRRLVILRDRQLKINIEKDIRTRFAAVQKN